MRVETHRYLITLLIGIGSDSVAQSSSAAALWRRKRSRSFYSSGELAADFSPSPLSARSHPIRRTRSQTIPGRQSSGNFCFSTGAFQRTANLLRHLSSAGKGLYRRPDDWQWGLPSAPATLRPYSTPPISSGIFLGRPHPTPSGLRPCSRLKIRAKPEATACISPISSPTIRRCEKPTSSSSAPCPRLTIQTLSFSRPPRRRPQLPVARAWARMSSHRRPDRQSIAFSAISARRSPPTSEGSSIGNRLSTAMSPPSKSGQSAVGHDISAGRQTRP